jgi:hypothetical protein
MFGWSRLTFATVFRSTKSLVFVVQSRLSESVFHHHYLNLFPIMKSKILLLLFALLATVCALQAQATLSMQGTIRNSTGSAVSDGTYSLTFKLYTVESGGTAVWTETQDNIKVVGGVYSALLGATEPLNAAFNVPYFVGIAVDGGSELIPRFRLTSAPYALSLIGQSNSFPSAGPVGVGTASPLSKLHVHDDDHVQLKITTLADKYASIRLNAGDHTGYLDVNENAFAIGSENLNMNILANRVGVGTYSPSTKLHVHDDNDVEMRITTLANKGASMRINAGDHTGYLSVNQYAFGIGSENLAMNISASRVHLHGDGGLKAYTDPDGFVVNGRIHIAGGVGQYFPGITVAYGNGQVSGAVYGNQSHGVSVRGENNLVGPAFVAFSDRRIKKDLRVSSGSDDLATLMQLEVTNYRHIDTLAKGSGEVKGFIAQQVENIFPQAVTVGVDVIPDIFSKPAAIQVNGTEATLRMPAAHSLAEGNRVRIMQDGGVQMEYEVVRVEGNAFTVKSWDAAYTQPEKVFVYGKQVNDFRTVDYDKIHNLNVSATQELARQVEQLQAENAVLRRNFDAMQRANEAVNGRLAKLEVLLETGNSKR